MIAMIAILWVMIILTHQPCHFCPTDKPFPLINLASGSRRWERWWTGPRRLHHGARTDGDMALRWNQGDPWIPWLQNNLSIAVWMGTARLIIGFFVYLASRQDGRGPNFILTRRVTGIRPLSDSQRIRPSCHEPFADRQGRPWRHQWFLKWKVGLCSGMFFSWAMWFWVVWKWIPMHLIHIYFWNFLKDRGKNPE